MAASCVALRRARVTARDHEGTSHTVEVNAGSLFEAAALALAAYREEGWLGELPANAALEVLVLPPPVRHVVTLAAVERWLEAAPKSPREKVIKDATGRSRGTSR